MPLVMIYKVAIKDLPFSVINTLLSASKPSDLHIWQSLRMNTTYSFLGIDAKMN
jgi:hypothetical protein